MAKSFASTGDLAEKKISFSEIGLGFYAAFGTSDLARVLALPGAVLVQVGELVQ